MDTNARLTGYYFIFVVNLAYGFIQCRNPRVPLDIYEFERAGRLRVSSLRSVQFLSQRVVLKAYRIAREQLKSLGAKQKPIFYPSRWKVHSRRVPLYAKWFQSFEHTIHSFQ